MDEEKLKKLWLGIYKHIKDNEVSVVGGKKRKKSQRGGNKVESFVFALYDALLTTLLVLVAILKLSENPNYESTIDDLIQNPENAMNLAVEPEMEQALVLVKKAKPTIQNKDSSQNMLLLLRGALQGIGIKKFNNALFSILPFSKHEKAFRNADPETQKLLLLHRANELASFAKAAAKAIPQNEKKFYSKVDALYTLPTSTSMHGSKIIDMIKKIDLPSDKDENTFSFDKIYKDSSIKPTNTYNPLFVSKKEDDLVGMAPSDIKDIDGGKRRKRKTNKRKKQTQKRRGRKTRRYYY